ncbi:MAG: M20 metallopeptidase family protein [Bacillota bacterium]
MINIHEEIIKEANSIYNNLIKIRRDLHQNPEISGNEVETSRKIEKYLKDLGVEVRSKIGGCGVVGILRGTRPGKSIAWRADMDALKDDSPDVVDFPSKVTGIRHTCGHDVNTTIALGIAAVLHSFKRYIKGTIVFIFQPAEEDLSGADKMIREGILDDLQIESIFASHIVPLPAGVVSVKSKEMYYVRKKIEIKLDMVETTDNIVNQCISLLKQLTKIFDAPRFNDISSLIDPALGVNSPNSIFKDYIFLEKEIKVEKSGSELSIEASFKSSNEENLFDALNKLKSDISRKEWQSKVKSVEFSFEQPFIYNDPETTDLTIDMIKSIYGENSSMSLYGVIPNFNEDFALFQQRVKGVYFFLGGSDYKKGIISLPHSPNFAVDESSIEAGVKYFSSMLYEYLHTINN